jgi:hypothetical protein
MLLTDPHGKEPSIALRIVPFPIELVPEKAPSYVLFIMPQSGDAVKEP